MVMSVRWVSVTAGGRTTRVVRGVDACWDRAGERRYDRVGVALHLYEWSIAIV